MWRLEATTLAADTPTAVFTALRARAIVPRAADIRVAVTLLRAPVTARPAADIPAEDTARRILATARPAVTPEEEAAIEAAEVEAVITAAVANRRAAVAALMEAAEATPADTDDNRETQSDALDILEMTTHLRKRPCRDALWL